MFWSTFEKEQFPAPTTMGGKKSKKRKHTQYADDDVNSGNNVGVGATIADLRADATEHLEMEGRSDSREWTNIGRGGKKQKVDNYPSLGYSELHKLQSMVNINHLQGLVLYCLADGNMAPSWVSVRHHRMVRKAVVLFVPGLERGMFDGSIELEAPEENLINFSEPASDTPEPVAAAEDLIDMSNSDIPSNPFIAQGSKSGPLINLSSAGNDSTESLRPEKNAQSSVASDLNKYRESHYIGKIPQHSPDNYVPEPLTHNKLPLPLKPLADCFAHLWPVKAPGDEKYGKVFSPLHAMLNSPIPKTQEEKREDKQIKGPKPAREGKNWENKRTSITEFIASREELQDNEYILHHLWFTDPEESVINFGQRFVNKQTAEDGWVDTNVKSLDDGAVPDENIQAGSITGGRVVLAMDCEMCMVEGGEMALTRISLVEWDGTVLLDEFIKPDKPIINYLTPYSGITPAKLKNVTTTLKDIQTRLLQEITPRHILIGHSLNADLLALRLTHPFLIDTSILYPHPRGPPMKSSLKWLTQKYLNREIQKGHGTMGHDSIEDARACLDLVKLKCERGPQWGTSEAANESIFKRLKRSAKSGLGNDSSHDNGKIGAVIDHGKPERNFGSMASYCISCVSDAKVVEGVKRAVHGDEDGSNIPGGGVDFTWARFQELASVRGWLLDYKHSTVPKPEIEPSTAALGEAVSNTVHNIKAIRDSLPPCTLFIVCSGTGDPREMARLQEMQRTFKREYQTKKWDELSVKWTDVEEQGLKAAVRKARVGVGFVTIT